MKHWLLLWRTLGMLGVRRTPMNLWRMRRYQEWVTREFLR